MGIIKDTKRNLRKSWYEKKGYYPVNVKNQSFKCDVEHLRFWQRINRGKWEPETFEIFSTFLKNEHVCYDIGSWIGPTVLFSSRLCRQVYGFEPDPIAYKYLLRNIELNGIKNAVPFKLAISNKTCKAKLMAFSEKMGESMSSLLDSATGGEPIDVECISWNDLMKEKKLEEPDFIKMDIEGGEFNLIPTMQEIIKSKKPILYLSTHSRFVEEDKRKKKMEGILNILSSYKTCYNEKLEKVDMDILLSKETLDGFCSFIFE